MARPARKLIDSGVPNTFAPTPGYGLTLTHKGVLPASVLAQVYSTWPSGTPDAGEEFVYEADATNGVYWRFKLVPSQATYDWVFIGGSPLVSEVTTGETTSSATYAALTTAGPSVALPRGGDYMVEISCRVGNNTASTTTFMSYDIGGTGAVDGDGIQLSIGAATSQSNTVHSSHPRRKTALTAVTLTAKYKTNGGTATFADRVMCVTPIRLT